MIFVLLTWSIRPISYFKEWDVSKKSQLSFETTIPMFTFDGYASWDDERIDYEQDPDYNIWLRWKGTL